MENYRSLFPESYVANIKPSTYTYLLHTFAVWGQFENSEHELRRDLLDQYLADIRAMEQVTKDAMLRALPYPPQETRAPIEDFYTLYGV